MIHGVWYDAPITLKSNVVELHEKLFGQVDYQPTDNVLMINEEVKMETQYYGEEDIDYDLLQRYLDTFGGGPNAGQSLNTGNPGNSDYTDDSGSDYSDDGSSEEEYYSAPASDGGDDSGGGYTEPATEPAPAPEPEPVEEDTTSEGDGDGQ